MDNRESEAICDNESSVQEEAAFSSTEKAPHKVVLIRTDRIGEVLLSTVAVDAIRSNYPEVSISFVTSEYSRPLLENRDDLENIITVDTMKKGGVVLRAFDLAAKLRKGYYDTAVVLNPHKVLHAACFLAGIPRRVGYDRKWGFFLNRKIHDERDKGDKHEVEYVMELLNMIGIESAGALCPRLPVSPGARHTIKMLLEQKKVSLDKPLVCVHPGSSNPSKIWPQDLYAELVRRIKTDLDCNVAVIGSLDEVRSAGILKEKAGVEVLDLTGVLDLEELAAFLECTSLFVGNDTGPMHMAAAVEVPVIAIFGRNMPGVSPIRWSPCGEDHIVFHEDPGCDPCYDAKCPYEYKCLSAITVDTVFNAVAKRVIK